MALFIGRAFLFQACVLTVFFQKLKVFMCMQVFSCFLLCAANLWVPLMLVPECFAGQSFVICVEVRVASAGIKSSYWQRPRGSLVHSWIFLEIFGLLCQTCYGEPSIYWLPTMCQSFVPIPSSQWHSLHSGSLSPNPLVRTSIYPSVHLSIHLLIHPSSHPSTY